jgi:hypothetical protein
VKRERFAAMLEEIEGHRMSEGLPGTHAIDFPIVADPAYGQSPSKRIWSL